MKTGRKELSEEEKSFKALKRAQFFKEQLDELIIKIKDWTTEELKKQTSIYFNIDKKIARFMSAKYILRKYHIMTDILTDEIKAYSEDTKYYQKIGTEKIKSFLTKEFNVNNSRSDSEEILHLIRTMTYVTEDQIKKARNKDLIPLKNGIFDLKQNKLIEHNPKYLFDYQIPIYYNSEAKCEQFNNFLSDVVEEKYKTLIYDIFGLSIYPENVLEKFFVLTGSGSNGKSVFINILEEFIGHENKSAISLKQMTEDKFAVAKMYKKLLNVGADISGDVINDTSFLKSASAKDSVSGQFKFGQIFDFVPSATLVYSANTPPLFKDNSDGMNRRPELIPFPNKFGNDKDVEEDNSIKKADPNIKNKIITENEMSGILNKAIEHLKCIIKNGQLSVVRSIKNSKLLYKRYSNSAIAFLEEFCEECPYIPCDSYNEGGRKKIIPAEGFIFLSELYPIYKKWCISSQLQQKPRNSFSKAIFYMEEWNIEVGQKDTNENGHKERSIRGIKWKGDDDDL